MSPRLVRAGLSLMMALGCWCGRIEAQTPVVLQEPLATQTVVVPADASAEPVRPGLRLASWPLLQNHRERMNQHGYCCQSHHDWYGCGSWRAQATFVLGSCRAFFGEPCLPGGPPGQGRGPGGNCAR